MIIISPFKDYYDYLAHQYRDPKLVYRRDMIVTKHPAINPRTYGMEVDTGASLDWLPTATHEIRSYNHFLSRKSLSLSCLVVCNKMFLVAYKLSSIVRPEFKLFTEDNFPELVPSFISHVDKRYSNLGSLLNSKIEDDRVIELSRILQHPVYLITSDILGVRLYVSYYVPVLLDSGISKLYSPFELFQDIAYFVGNILHESPDLAPPVEIQDKYKIIQHGFDKRSFRH